MVVWTILLSLMGALVLLLIPPGRARLARWLALSFALVGAGLGFAAFAGSPGAGLDVLVRVPWIPSWGVDFYLAADGISRLMVLLTGVAGVAGVCFSWNVEQRPAAFFALYLALLAGVYGVFLSRDLLVLFFFYELAILPKYCLIAFWGSTRREYAAMKLALYSFAGSALVLAGIAALHAVTGGQGLDLDQLAGWDFSTDFQVAVFPLFFIGFGILAGLWPFHTWAPTGHVAAPTGASMLLAGVIMKLGAYGILRVAVPLFPEGLAMWQVPAACLAVAGILAGAFVALVQRDFKFVIGYSSVSHMGFVLLGLVSLNATGMSGAVLQMFSHGILAGLLFGVVGRMIYDRAHTRDLEELEGLRLARRLPFAAVTFVLAGLASMGLPGFSGFIAEIQVLIGAWQNLSTFAVLAGVGIVVAAAYTLRVFQRGLGLGEAAAPAEIGGAALPPISPAEKAGALLLLLATLWVGLFPGPVLKEIQHGLDTLPAGVLQGGDRS